MASAGTGVRDLIDAHYDSLLAKLIVYGADRAQAIARMARALDELLVVGVDTSAPYLRDVMDEPDFARGDLSAELLVIVLRLPDVVARHPDLDRRILDDR